LEGEGDTKGERGKMRGEGGKEKGIKERGDKGKGIEGRGRDEGN
jgi:hypothetical protein